MSPSTSGIQRPSCTCRPQLALLLSAAFLLACSRTTAPRPPTTLHIINATCDAGACSAVHVLGFPKSPNQLSTPGGLWSLDLGTDSAATFCVTILRSGTFQVIAQADGGSTDTTTFSWSDQDSLSLGTLAAGESPFTATPSTRAFVPASSPGWSVALPGSTAVTPAQPCNGS
jgi:hypothetical protein